MGVLDDAIRERLSDYVGGLKKLVPNVKWVRPESLHVTLKFIGEFPEARLDELKRALGTVGGSALQLSFRNAGFFTSRSPRVFWTVACTTTRQVSTWKRGC